MLVENAEWEDDTTSRMTAAIAELDDRSKRIIWLNPEARLSWNTGDSEMRRYQAYSHQVEECNSLMHLERVIGNLLKQVSG